MSWGSEIRPAAQRDRDEAVELSRQLDRQGYKNAILMDETRILTGQEDSHPFVQASVRSGIRALEDNNAITPDQIFRAIEHGDQEHRDWLKEALDAIFTGKPVPSPRGKGTASYEA